MYSARWQTDVDGAECREEAIVLQVRLHLDWSPSHWCLKFLQCPPKWPRVGVCVWQSVWLTPSSLISLYHLLTIIKSFFTYRQSFLNIVVKLPKYQLALISNLFVFISLVASWMERKYLSGTFFFRLVNMVFLDGKILTQVSCFSSEVFIQQRLFIIRNITGEGVLLYRLSSLVVMRPSAKKDDILVQQHNLQSDIALIQQFYKINLSLVDK